MKKLILIALAVSMVACTSNNMARNWGGTTTYDLEPGRKFMNISWEDQDLWIVTRDRQPGETPAHYMIEERSNYGLQQGHIIINEH